MSANPKLKYDAVAMTLHWVTAVLIIFMIIFGEDLIKVRSGADAASVTVGGFFLPSVHVTIGVTVLILSVLRLLWRLVNPPPPLPDTMAPWEKLISKLMHLLFYIALIGLPLTGWLSFGHYVTGRPAVASSQVFGLFPLPLAPDLGDIGGALHGLGSNATMVLVILHVLAALKHHFLNRDDVMRRMLPH